jgi:hypothetical protein
MVKTPPLILLIVIFLDGQQPLYFFLHPVDVCFQ